MSNEKIVNLHKNTRGKNVDNIALFLESVPRGQKTTSIMFLVPQRSECFIIADFPNAEGQNE